MKSAIGIFDSGVGGLTVFRELSRLLPNESLIYLGDTARLPYGNKSSEVVLRYSKECSNFLLQEDIKLLVIACHTASSHALESLKKSLPIPVFGMLAPGVELIRQSQCKKIAILGTSSTIASNVYQNMVLQQNPDAKIFPLACPLFVPLAEEGLHQHEIARQIAHHYLSPLKSESIEIVLLACTHYPLLRSMIQEALGPSIQILEPASRCAEHVRIYLTNTGLLDRNKKDPEYRFCTTDHPERFAELAAIFLGTPVKKPERVSFPE